MYSYILKVNSRESNYKSYTTNPIQVSYNNMSNSSLINRITIKGASIPNVFYNIRAGNNNLTFSRNNVLQSLNFPEGNYTVASFITFFNASNAAIVSQLTLSFNTRLNKIEATSLIHPTTFIGIPINNYVSTCFNIIGLRTGENFVADSTFGAVPFLFMSDFSGIRNIYAETTFNSMSYLDSTGHKSYAGIIPCDQPFGSIIHYTNDSNDMNNLYRNNLYSQNMSKIEIALLDVEGNLLNLQNMNWEISFQVTLSHEHDLQDE